MESVQELKQRLDYELAKEIEQEEEYQNELWEMELMAMSDDERALIELLEDAPSGYDWWADPDEPEEEY